MRESIRERRAFARIAPRFVSPLAFVMPTSATLTENPFAADRHGDRWCIADHLEHLRRDERHRFGIVQPQPAREAFLRERSSLMQRQLLELLGRQMHKVTIFLAPAPSP